MILFMAIIAFTLLFLGFPFMVVLIGTFIATTFFYLPDLNMNILIQQILGGIKPLSLVCVPMFILAGNIITSGQSAKRLVKMVKAYLGHLFGGLPIVTNVACTLFGAVSGSTQATVSAIGGTMRPMLLEAGYSSSFTLGLIINSSDIAFLIPPSIGFIVYGVATQTSVGKLFLAGILPGILICILFSIFCYFYSRYYKIGRYPKSSWKERIQVTREGILLIGFPILILGGIYGGIFSPTEAAASAVLYALVLEGFIYRSLNFKKLIEVALSTAVITGVVFILVGAGQALAWFLSYSGIAKQILPPLFGPNPSALKVIIIINIAYFIACMFVDPIVAIYVLTPLFAPYVAQTGIDKIFLGVLVTMQAAIGSATPPCGCDIFTAMVLFKRPYLEVIRMTWPFILILLLAVGLVIIFPELALFIPRTALGG
jgi:tripartite ATP-independent transporter DctM subunit